MCHLTVSYYKWPISEGKYMRLNLLGQSGNISLTLWEQDLPVESRIFPLNALEAQLEYIQSRGVSIGLVK